MVGTSGSAAERFCVVTASGKSLPSRMKGMPDEVPTHMKSTRPVITSVSASGPPRNGMCVALKPALSRKRSAAQCVALPTPADA